MATEIERKFLVVDERWQAESIDRHEIVQAYLAVTDKAEIRVRIVDNASATLTVKSAGSSLSRGEFEADLPVEQAQALLGLRVGALLEKVRYRIKGADDRIWEIDEFGGDQSGLVLAEVELPDRDAAFERPDWLGEEVTGNSAFYNASLAGARP